MTKERANAVFNVLVKHAGARESLREDFVFHMEEGCLEFRFGGLLGFGGKYRPERNTVDCYREDETVKSCLIIEATNKALSQL